MIPMNGKKLENVIIAFKKAHREKENVQVCDNWQLRVMAIIRGYSKDKYNTGFLDLFQQFVWRLAPVSFLVILLLGIVITRLDFLSDYKLIKLFIIDPSDFSFFSLYKG